MLTEQTPTEPNWKLLPGTILDGGYELEELLDADERRARFKIRVLGDRTIEAYASLFPASGPAAQEQIDAWELLRRIPHPNVSKPFGAGRRQLAGVEVIYVVLRKPDETLNGVLKERALTGDEAAEVLLSGARGLEHLGRHGLVHGSVSPEEVLAVGDSIQLSSEGVRKGDGTVAGAAHFQPKYTAPESVRGNTTTAAAIWCLGATVFETLTQRECGEGCREQARQVPLGWVLEKCLEPDPNKRCKPEEIPVLARSAPPPEVVVPVVAAPAATPEVAASIEKMNVVSVPAQEVKAATASGAGNAAMASAAGNAASDASLETRIPSSTPAKQMAPDIAAAKPALSVSQARTKAFQQAEFDVLTAPKGTAVGPKAMASAAAGVSAASAGLGATQRGAATGRSSSIGLTFESGAAGSRPSGLASFDAAQAEMGRRSGRATFGMEPEPQRSRLWLYVAAAVAVLLLLVWALRSKTATANKMPTGAAAVAQNTSSPAPAVDNSVVAGKAWPTRTLEPDKAGSGASVPATVSKSSAAGSKPLGAKPETISTSAAVWRVVVYTFNRPEEADKKVRGLNSKHPRLNAQVFTPNQNAGPYLVTVGGKMTREEATRFRSRALGAGLPRDAYIQNYKP